MSLKRYFAACFLAAFILIASIPGASATFQVLLGTPGVAAPFTPLSISGCQLWLDANQLSLSNNDPVSTWTDFSTHGRDATQSGGNRPVFKTSVINGKAAVLFVSTSSQYMTGSLTLSQPMTVFAVVQHTTTGWDYEFTLDGSTNRVALLKLSAGSGYDLFAGTDAIVTGYDDTSWHYISGVVNGASSKLVIDGSVTSGLDTGTNSLGSTYVIGCDGPSLGTFGMNGYIAEMIIYDTALSDSDRVLVQNYLKTKYGL